MYTAKEEYYKALYEKPVVKSYVTGTIFHDAGAISISDQNIVKGSLSINNRCVNGSGFEYGAVYQGEMNITLMIDAGRYSLYDKKISLTAHYVLDNETVSIPLGQWKISTPERSKKLLTIKALDAMSDFSQVIPAAFTGTAYEMLSAACTACGVPLGMTRAEVEALTNGKVSFYANTEYFDTYRDLLSYLGKCTCTFATINRNGALILREYGTASVRTIPETRRSGTVVADYETYHKAVKMRFLAEENFFPYEKGSGVDGISMDLGDIPIVRGSSTEKQAVCDAIYAKLSSVRYTPAYFVQLVGDPTLELGDMITVDGQKTYVMSYTWNHHGSMRIQGVGDDAKHPKFKNKNLVDVPTLNDTLADVGVDHEEVEDIVQQAMQEATALINGAEGGYFTIMTDNVVVDGVAKEVPIGWRVMNTPSLTENTKLWQMSMGGFAFSSDGGKTFTNVAIDMNGNIAANNVVSGTIVGGTITGATISGGKLDCENAEVTGLVVGQNIEVDNVFIYGTDSTETGISVQDVLHDYDVAISAGMVKVSGGGTHAELHPGGLYADWIEVDKWYCGGDSYTPDDFASTYHSHSEYYESGDTMRANYMYIASLGSNSSATPLYISPSSGIVCDEPSSSRRYKNSIKEVDEGVLKPEKLYDLPVRQYKWNEGHFMEDEGYDYDTNHIGFIAEEVAEFYPYAAVMKNGVVETWDSRKLVAPMLQLIQNQKTLIDDLTERVKRLEALILKTE